MSKYKPGERDWDDEAYLAWRRRLTTVIPELDAFFDEVRADAHEGSCWDLINDLAQVLAYSIKEPGWAQGADAAHWRPGDDD